MMVSTLLDLHFQKRFTNFDLDLNIDLPSGITAVFGPSGSGKTTLLNCISGLIKPDSGEIILNETVLFSNKRTIDLPPERRGIGYVFQKPLLFPHLSVHKNILFGYHNTPQRHRLLEPTYLIDMLELQQVLARHPNSLSGGEAQRVALARALAISPKILLLDEPLQSLDGRLRTRIIDYLKNLHQELSIPILLVSHSLTEVLTLADRMIAIDNGAVVANGGPLETLSLRQVRNLVGEISFNNFLELEIKDHLPQSGLSVCKLGSKTILIPQVERPVSSKLFVSIRATDILIATERPNGISARNILEGTINSFELVENGVLVGTLAGRPLFTKISLEAQSNLELKVGKQVFLIIKSSAINILE